MPSRFFGRVVLPDVVTTVNLASSSQLVLASAALSISSTGLGADYDEEEHARYKDRLRKWLPILEWYAPFANKSERGKIYDVVPEQWLLP